MNRRKFQDTLVSNSHMNTRINLTTDSWVDTRIAECGLTFEEFEELWREKPVDKATILLYGKQVQCPRYTRNYLVPYTFSGTAHVATPTLPPVLEKIYRESKLQCPELNQCLVNFYDADGAIGKHSDDEPNIVKGSEIHSWTFGPAKRVFVIEPKNHTMLTRYKISVDHNSLLVMGGTCQQTHVHYVPKQKVDENGDERRINVTFRCFKNKT